MPRRTYLDSGVLIAAFRAQKLLSERAMEILSDSDRTFLVSDVLRLELLPQPTFHRREDELKFMKEYFRLGEEAELSRETMKRALELAGKYPLHPMDALHVAVALEARADEFITVEKKDKPLCKVKEIRVVSLHD